MAADNKTILKENAPRLIAIFFAMATLAFAVKSILENETSKTHRNYNIGNILAPVMGIFNVLGRIQDHWPHLEKRKNIMSGMATITGMLIQISCSVASVLSQFNQPIALPLLLSAFSLTGVSGLNWESGDKTLRKNAGRIAAAISASATIGFATSAILKDNNRLFFAASSSMCVAGLGESSNRVLDIVHTNKDKSNLINKACAILFLAGIAAAAIASTLAATNQWNQPIAFNLALTHVALVFYIVAQFNFNPKPNEAAAPLLPPTPPTLQMA